MVYSLEDMPELGTIEHEEFVKDAQLFMMAIPRKDADEAIVLDLFGAQGTITIRGTFQIGDGGLTIAQFTQDIENLIQGTQVSRVYTSDTTANSPFNVFVQTSRWNFTGGEANSVGYEIVMLVGKQVI